MLHSRYPEKVICSYGSKNIYYISKLLECCNTNYKSTLIETIRTVKIQYFERDFFGQIKL